MFIGYRRVNVETTFGLVDIGETCVPDNDEMKLSGGLGCRAAAGEISAMHLVAGAGWACSLGSGRQGRSPAGESPAVSITRFGHVAIPQFEVGNPSFIAWCKRPSHPVSSETPRWARSGGLASVGA
jgi:hypothetical protein